MGSVLSDPGCHNRGASPSARRRSSAEEVGASRGAQGPLPRDGSQALGRGGEERVRGKEASARPAGATCALRPSEADVGAPALGLRGRRGCVSDPGDERRGRRAPVPFSGPQPRCVGVGRWRGSLD